MVMIQNNLELEPDLLAQLLFGTFDQRSRVVHLIELAKRACQAELITSRKAQVPITEGACYLNDVPHLSRVLEELQATQVQGPLTLERAAELNHEGLRHHHLKI